MHEVFAMRLGICMHWQRRGVAFEFSSNLARLIGASLRNGYTSSSTRVGHAWYSHAVETNEESHLHLISSDTSEGKTRSRVVAHQVHGATHQESRRRKRRKDQIKSLFYLATGRPGKIHSVGPQASRVQRASSTRTRSPVKQRRLKDFPVL